MFVLPPIGVSSSHTKAKSMDNKESAMMVMFGPEPRPPISPMKWAMFFGPGHLQCKNIQCDYLQRAHRTSLVSGTDFNGFTKEPFRVGGPLPLGSTLCAGFVKSLPCALHYAMPKYSTSTATDLVGEFLLCNDSAPHQLLLLEKLELIFYCCK